MYINIKEVFLLILFNNYVKSINTIFENYQTIKKQNDISDYLKLAKTISEFSQNILYIIFNPKVILLNFDKLFDLKLFT